MDEHQAAVLQAEEAGIRDEGPPAEAKEVRRKRPRRRGRVTVFENWCKGCGLCVAFCPPKVFENGPDGHPVVAHEDRCTACNWCYEHCPDFAITIEAIEDEEPAEAVAGEVQR